MPPDTGAAALARTCARVDELGRAFHDILVLLERHAPEHYDVFNRPNTRGIIDALLVEDTKTSVREVNRFVDEIPPSTFYPPDNVRPRAPLPLFPDLRAYVAVAASSTLCTTVTPIPLHPRARGAGGGGGRRPHEEARSARSLCIPATAAWGPNALFSTLRRGILRVAVATPPAVAAAPYPARARPWPPGRRKRSAGVAKAVETMTRPKETLLKPCRTSWGSGPARRGGGGGRLCVLEPRALWTERRYSRGQPAL